MLNAAMQPIPHLVFAFACGTLAACAPSAELSSSSEGVGPQDSGPQNSGTQEPVVQASAVPAAESADGLIFIPAGQLLAGAGDERRPSLTGIAVDVAAFRIEAHEVTNDRFAEFVSATSHVTDAERIGDSVVFTPGQGWSIVRGADWQHPLGPGDSIESRGTHPVVHVSFADAQAFAAWAGLRLPTETEWEWAARGGLVAAPYAWGDDLRPGGVFQANCWQGVFPELNRLEDGFASTAPVGTFPANGYGLHDVSGNVWEWVSTQRGEGPVASLHEPRSVLTEPGLDFQIRGGSFLCAENYCQGYRPSERQFKLERDASNNVGFRCAADAR